MKKTKTKIMPRGIIENKISQIVIGPKIENWRSQIVTLKNLDIPFWNIKFEEIYGERSVLAELRSILKEEWNDGERFDLGEMTGEVSPWGANADLFIEKFTPQGLTSFR